MVIPRRMPMPTSSPLLGTVIEVSIDAGLWKVTRFGSSLVVIGRSSTPLFRGRMLPFMTKATRPSSSSCALAASWSSTDRMWDLSAPWSMAPKYMLLLTTSMSPPTICAARWPSTLRPRAGRLSVSLASTKAAVATIHVLGRTYWPGASMFTSPPLLPPQPPPETACVQSVPVPPRSMSAITRVRKSHRAVLRTWLWVTYSAGNPAAAAGSRTRTQLGGAYGSPCTLSKKILAPSQPSISQPCAPMRSL
mmetsp:Transcript_43947/g.125840  ORF Transcript_43947/g.125840 Transcript_43947/m.125840 type:complete len:249 (+) Transcript_43947:825-1571(+)